MSTIGGLHKKAVLGTAGLGTLGIIGGSTTLLAAGAASLLSLVYAAIDLHEGERSLARRWLVHGLTVVLLVLILLLLGTLKIDAVFMILMLGVANRALLRASTRDDVLIVGGAAVLFSAATVVTSGLGFAVLLALAVPSAAIALWASTMLASAEPSPAELARLRARRAPRGAAGIGTAALLLTILGFGVSTMLPRYRFTPFLGAGAFAALPGSSDSMELTNQGGSDLDDAEVVLRVFPREGAGPGLLTGIYARLYSLDAFDGRTWSATSGGHYSSSAPMDRLMTEHPTARVAENKLMKTYAHHPIAVLGREGPWALAGPGIHFDLSGTAVVDGLQTRGIEYQVAIGAPLAPPSRVGGLAATHSQDRMALPESLDPRVRALAAELTAGKTSDAEKIAAILGHFSSGFRYSTEAMDGQEDDPLARFLFESKAAHCELYAGAVATLLRASGVEARVASGYYLGRWNELGEFLAFTQGDAHAWVEVNDAGTWRWIDATPASERGRRDEGVMRRLRDWYDVLSAAWFDNVVDYDARRQQQFYMRISTTIEKRLQALGRDPAGAAGDLGRSLLEGARETPAWLTLLPVVIGLLALAWRRHDRASVEGLGRRLRRALGAGLEENVTLGQLVARSGRGGEEVALYERLRFGPPSEQPAIAEVRAKVRALERRERQET